MRGLEHAGPHSDCLYHLTPARNLASIAAQGLVPQIDARNQSAGEKQPLVHCYTAFEQVERALPMLLKESAEGEKWALLVINVQPQGHCGEGCDFAVTLRPHLLWVVSDSIRRGEDISALRAQKCVTIEEYMTHAPQLEMAPER